MHVSSLGEFEQGRPVLERFHQDYPEWEIVLSFFSPSGYEIRKEYPIANYILYLPTDTPRQASDFLNIFKPDIAIFVKYDFWANYLLGLKNQQTPTLLISALFRPSQLFFKWYGSFWRNVLSAFSEIQVQNERSAELLKSINIDKCIIAGDTRIDRVMRLAKEVAPNKTVEEFSNGKDLIIAGSTWEADEKLLSGLMGLEICQNMKFIIAPHAPSEQNITRICSIFENAVRYSAFKTGINDSSRVLVIDNVGMLNSLYRYGKIAYIGGGFGSGIHNTLEPAAFGLPILFGPKYRKFEEAVQFVARNGAFSVLDTAELVNSITSLQDPVYYKKASNAVLHYLAENEGASEVAMNWIHQHTRHKS